MAACQCDAPAAVKALCLMKVLGSVDVDVDVKVAAHLAMRAGEVSEKAFLAFLYGVTRIVRTPVQRKSSGGVTLSSVRQFGECVFSDWNSDDVSSERRLRCRAIVESVLLCPFGAGAYETNLLRAAQACDAMPDEFTDYGAITLVTALMADDLENLSDQTLTTLGEIASIARTAHL